jgi:hypothetical protein
MLFTTIIVAQWMFPLATLIQVAMMTTVHRTFPLSPLIIAMMRMSTPVG